MLKPVVKFHSRRLRALRAALRENIRELGVEESVSVEMLCALLSEKRGRPIIRRPVENLSPHASGVWVDTTDADYIFYEAAASPAHAEHIVLHELGHLIRAHQSHTVTGHIVTDHTVTGHTVADEDLLPGLSPLPVYDGLWRARYSDAQEVEAEVSAYVLGRLLDCNRSRLLREERPSAGPMEDRIGNCLSSCEVTGA